MPQPAVVLNANTAELLSLNSDVASLNSPSSSTGSIQASTQNDTQTTKPKVKSSSSGKADTKKGPTATNTGKTTAKAPVKRTSCTKTGAEHQHQVIQGLNELKDLQQQSLDSMNHMISSVASAVQVITQSKTSRKRKRDEMSDSESTDVEDSAHGEMAGNPLDISTEVNDLLQQAETSKQSKTSKTDEDEVLGELSKLYESEGTVSEPINAKLASLVDKIVKTSLSEEKTKEKHEKYNRPQNCENLINTRVNPEIWSKIRSNTRSRDLRMQKLETSLNKSMIPIIKIVDKMLELKSNSKPASETDVSAFLQLSLDSLALLGHSINEVNLKRRELIKPELNDQFKQLCSSQTPVTKLLFGDDLPKSVKEISETNKVGVKVSSKQSNHFPKHQKRSNSSPYLRPFLWKSQGSGRRSIPDPKRKGKSEQQH